jgi:hypothetical protein
MPIIKVYTGFPEWLVIRIILRANPDLWISYSTIGYGSGPLDRLQEVSVF